jgi:hypothetical protein
VKLRLLDDGETAVGTTGIKHGVFGRFPLIDRSLSSLARATAARCARLR